MHDVAHARQNGKRRSSRRAKASHARESFSRKCRMTRLWRTLRYICITHTSVLRKKDVGCRELLRRLLSTALISTRLPRDSLQRAPAWSTEPIWVMLRHSRTDSSVMNRRQSRSSTLVPPQHSTDSGLHAHRQYSHFARF